MSKKYFVQRHLSSLFRRLGSSAGKYPWSYTIIPLIVTAVFSIRIYWVSLNTDVEYLYSPINNRVSKEREAIESIFPPTSYGVNVNNMLKIRRMATLLAEAKDGESVLREDILKEVSQINNIIFNITVICRGRNYTYADLCSKRRTGDCQPNDVLNLMGRTEDIRRKQLRLKYPFHIEALSKVSLYVFGLGGVTTDENDYIVDAKAVRLLYFLNDTSEEKDAAGYEWELSFQKVLLNLKFQTVRVSLSTSQSLNIEFSKFTEMSLPLITITAFIMMTFALLSCMTTEWITSKPWVAIAGCVSPVLAVATAFGFLLLCGVEYVDLNIVILFLLVGIGLDDSFVMLAAWRRTDPTKDVIARMSQTYEEAALSITITSVTNMLSLCIGISMPYRIVRLYCCYAATSVVFAYIYQITFFGGALALSGYREKNNRHPFLCVTVKKEHIPRSFLLKLLYIGCKRVNNENENTRTSKSEYVGTCFRFITNNCGKRVVLVIFLIYLSTAAYSLRFMKETFDYRDAMPYNSYLVNFYNMHYKHFIHYPHIVQVAINTTLDYSRKDVQSDIDEILESICSLPDMAGDKCKISWLKYYLESVKEKLLAFSYRGYNVSEPEDFVAALRDIFLKLPYGDVFRPFIKFNHNNTQIVASRFLVVSANVGSSEKERKLLSSILNKIDSFKYPVYIYNFWFPMYAATLDSKLITIETVCTAAASVVAVFFIFVPHLLCFAGIVLTIISIQIGVLGYMSLCGVTLNIVSMICVIVSVGLSVDYSAHICYAYLSCNEEDPNEKTKVALRHAGYPIIQGCLSTILGVLVLGFGPSNVFVVFFKVITLVMLIAAFHGLLVIPCLLNILEMAWRKLFRNHSELVKSYQNSPDEDFVRKESLFTGEEDDENIQSSPLYYSV